VQEDITVKTLVRCLVVVGLFVVVSACTPVRTEVTRFNQLSVPPGDTFVIIPMKGQEGLEFQAYASRVSTELTARGFRPVTSLPEAKYAVTFSYAVDNGTTITSQVPIFGQTGGGYTTYTGSSFGSVGSVPFSGMSTGTAYTPPTYGQVGSSTAVDTVYKRALVLDIYDVQASTKDHVVTLFEAKARSAGSNGSIAVVMPNMIAAVFKDFPGKNGETITVNAPLMK
jgi:hypothetical protein